LRIKICGLKTHDAVQAAVGAGATAVGFVFSPSVRRLTVQEARPLIEAVPHGVEAVAVFDRIDDTELLARVLDLGVDAVQSVDEPEGLKKAGAFWLRSVPDGPDLGERLGRPSASTIVAGSLRGCTLVDSAAGGGSGRVADWERIAEVAGGYPLILAGGLTPENVGDAIRAVRPIGVDVSSGVESLPGLKDAGRIQAFVDAVNAAR
jgi:phosphoribosylanthranilate isomerase